MEEIAFEVVSEQAERDVTEKAVRMHRRGVRRIFSIVVKGQRRVSEWSPESQSWRPLAADSLIEDPSLVAPLAVAALLDAAAAKIAVVKGLAAQGNPELQRRQAEARSEGKVEGKTEGKAEGKVEGILNILKARGVAVSEAQRQEIFLCHDLDRLDRWLVRAAFATSAEEVTAEP